MQTIPQRRRDLLLRPLVAALALLAAFLSPSPAAAYDTFTAVPRITGTLAAQRAVGQVFRDAETETRRVFFVGDSRLSSLGGSGNNMLSALVLGMATLTEHGNIPETSAVSTSTLGSTTRAPFVAFNHSGAVSTGLQSTVTSVPANLEPSGVAPATIGTLRVPIFSGGQAWWGFDPECRWMSPVLRGHSITAWSRANNIRGRVFCSTNATSATDLYVYMQGKSTETISDNGSPTTLSTTVIPVPELETATYAVYSYATPFVAGNGHEYYQLKVNCSDTDRIECGFGRFESSDPRGIAVQNIAQGGDTVTSFASERPDAGPWYVAMGPFHLGVVFCNVNDAYAASIAPATWETNLRQAIADIRRMSGSPSMPVIVWIQVERVSHPSTETTKKGYWDQYAGVAQVVAESMSGVVAINTARVIYEKWFQVAVNWYPNGAMSGTYSESNTYAANDIVIGDGVTITAGQIYLCLSPTSAGQDPIDTPAKWFRMDAPYSAVTVYAANRACTYGGRYWVNTSGADSTGNEPGATAVWTELPIYQEYVHPHAGGCQIIVDEFVSACRELKGYRRGYRSPGILPRRRLHPGRPSRSELYDTWRTSGGKAIASGPRRRRESGGVA